MSEYGKIFVSFFKIGLFTFGGGYAMMPLFRQELIEKRQYIAEYELIDYYSIGQCTPGVIAVNVATFVGYKVKGVLGAIVAASAIIFPSLVIILSLAGVLNVLSDNPFVAHAFAGIRVGVIALILNEVINLFKKAVTNRMQMGIFIVISAALLWGGFSAVMAVVAASVLGIIRFMRRR